MPLVISTHGPMEQAEYTRFVRDLRPIEVACIHCAHPVTHEHGAYERQPHGKGGQQSVWSIHRRLCPACEHTFALHPACMAPYQRVMIQVQDLVAYLLAGNRTYEQVVVELQEIGVTITAPTIRRWFDRISKQVTTVLSTVTSRVLEQLPNMALPKYRLKAKHADILYYYEILSKTANHSGVVNLWLGTNCLFAPSESVNRVSRNCAPGFSP